MKEFTTKIFSIFLNMICVWVDTVAELAPNRQHINSIFDQEAIKDLHNNWLLAANNIESTTENKNNKRRK